MDRRKALKFTGRIAIGTATGSAMMTLLQSCKQESRVDWTPDFLSIDEAVFISTFVDTILPRTDTPGALDVKVDIFLDRVFAHIYDAEGQQKIRSEITKFNTNCQSEYGAPFADLSTSDKEKVLREAEENDGLYNIKVWGTAVGPKEDIGFYRNLKSMAIWAFFTSEEIGKNVLSYDPIPGGYHGCLPADDVGNRWTL